MKLIYLNLVIFTYLFELSYLHIKWEVFSLKYHTENVVEKLFPETAFFYKTKTEQISESIP